MLEHVPDPGAVIKACADMAKPGASLYFSTIYRNPKAFMFVIVGAGHVVGQKALPELLQKSGLRVVDCWQTRCNAYWLCEIHFGFFSEMSHFLTDVINLDV